MKKLFMVLCVVIMFFGIVGCPSSDDPGTLSKTSFSSNSNGGTSVAQIGGPVDEGSPGSPVPEPATLILLGAGLVGLAGVGRKKLFKKD